MPEQNDDLPGPLPEQARMAVDEVAKVAQLALLDLTEADLKRFAGQLDAVLKLATSLEAFDLDGVPPTAHPFGITNIYRDDVAATGEDAEEMRRLALEGGPEIEDGRFKVPPALGEAP